MKLLFFVIFISLTIFHNINANTYYVNLTKEIFLDNDGDGVDNSNDLDNDNDGIPDAIEGTGDLDGDGVPNHFDLDSDNDGIYDLLESGQLNGTTVVDINNDGIIDGDPVNFGINGLFDPLETTSDSGILVYLTSNSDNDTTIDSNELDADNDACSDVLEAGFSDPDFNGLLGIGNFGSGLTVDAKGVVNTIGLTDGYTNPNDLDNNIVYDFQEANSAVQPLAIQPQSQTIITNTNASFTVDVQNQINYQWQESTDNGIVWNTIFDGGLNPVYSGTNTNTLTLISVPKLYNGNLYRVVLSSPAFICDSNIISTVALLTVALDFDGDGVEDTIDLDDENDGIPDTLESGGIDPSSDADADGVPVYLDDNDSNPSIGDDDGTVESAFDRDNDGTANHLDIDTDGDGIYDISETGHQFLDTNNDGIIEGLPADFGINGLFNSLETSTDSGIINYNLLDHDADGIANYIDIDSDGDGIPDNVESQSTSGYIAPSGTDTNNNGLDDIYDSHFGITPINTDGTDEPDYLDTDSDNDSVPDNVEAHDTNHNGIAERLPTGTDVDLDGLDDGYEGVNLNDYDVNDEFNDPENDIPNTDGTIEIDFRDTDDDDDGILTFNEDTNGDGDPTNDDDDSDGFPDYLDPTPLGIYDFRSDLFSIHPNPVSNLLFIDLKDSSTNITITIFNVKGQKVYTKIKQLQSDKTKIDLSKFKSGIYFIQIIADAKISIQQLLIQ